MLQLQRTLNLHCRVFEVARVALLVKQGISRSKNKHKPTAIDDSCMWKESGTYGLFSQTGLVAIHLCSSYLWTQQWHGDSRISSTSQCGVRNKRQSALPVSAVSGTEGNQLYQSVRCRGQKAGVAGSSCPPLSSEECHCSFSSAYQVRIVFIAPRRAIRSSPFLACLLLTCCSHCPCLWHPFCLPVATAPTYGILSAYLLSLPLLMASFVLTSCYYCPYLWHLSAYLLPLPLLMASFVLTSCYYCPYLWHLSAYLLLLLPLLMASFLLTCCYCPCLWHPFCLPVATAPVYGIPSAYLLLPLPLLLASLLFTSCYYYPCLWHPFCLPDANAHIHFFHNFCLPDANASTYGIRSGHLLLLSQSIHPFCLPVCTAPTYGTLLLICCY